jgi:hypothetical protein
MYNRFTLQTALRDVGLYETHVCKFNESWIENWNTHGLELAANGHQYTPGSLYVEGRVYF